ncbi:MAG TPA: AAA family ATPase [Microlunatus sp.]|nr:AAA family ATPase [Microlunatus sp.]
MAVHTRRAAEGPARTDATPAYDLVLVGGVPGAGKSTAIALATDDLGHVRAVDPEHVTWWLRRRLPGGVPYRGYRWVVHLVHTIRVLAHLLNGPTAGRRLVVHDPGTRAHRRGLFLRLAHLAGWRTVQLYVDVDRSLAQQGQLQRGRVVRSFEEHWSSWQHLRPALDTAARVRGPATGPGDEATAGDPVILVERLEAADTLRRLCLAA